MSEAKFFQPPLAFYSRSPGRERRLIWLARPQMRVAKWMGSKVILQKAHTVIFSPKKVTHWGLDQNACYFEDAALKFTFLYGKCRISILNPLNFVPSHYLIQCWAGSTTPYVVTRPQSVKENIRSLTTENCNLNILMKWNHFGTCWATPLERTLYVKCARTW